jgi:hypothetical protein
MYNYSASPISVKAAQSTGCGYFFIVVSIAVRNAIPKVAKGIAYFSNNHQSLLKRLYTGFYLTVADLTYIAVLPLVCLPSLSASVPQQAQRFEAQPIQAK